MWVTYVSVECCLPTPGSNSKRHALARKGGARGGDGATEESGAGVSHRRGPSGKKSLLTQMAEGLGVAFEAGRLGLCQPFARKLQGRRPGRRRLCETPR